MPPREQAHGAYLISDDPGRLDLAAIYDYLSQSYWAKGRPLETVRRALTHSLCIGAYDRDGAQVGLTRFISDYATFCYVCDVYVLENHRRHGLAKAMLGFAVNHPKLQGLRRWCLMTRDAQKLYSQFGFKHTPHPDRYMELLNPDEYKQPPAG